MRPIWFPPASVNQSAPSGPAVMSDSPDPATPVGGKPSAGAKAPVAVIRPDLADARRREPERAVRTDRDALGSTIREGYVVLTDGTRGGDSADLVVTRLGEPQCAVGAGRDLIEGAHRRGRFIRTNRDRIVIGHRPGRRHSPDRARALLDKPQRAVGPGGYAAGAGPRRGTGNSSIAPAAAGTRRIGSKATREPADQPPERHVHSFRRTAVRPIEHQPRPRCKGEFINYGVFRDRPVGGSRWGCRAAAH